MFLASNVVLLIVNLWLDLVFGLKTIYLFFCQYNLVFFFFLVQYNLVFLKKSINAFYCKKKNLLWIGSSNLCISVIAVQVGACRQWPKIYLCNEQRAGPAGQARSFHTHTFLFTHLNIDQEL